jgi:hypothetical protein
MERRFDRTFLPNLRQIQQPKSGLAAIQHLPEYGFLNNLMKKYICILTGAALLAACEQKTETVTPAASPSGTTSETTTTTSPGGTESTTTTTSSPAATP